MRILSALSALLLAATPSFAQAPTNITVGPLGFCQFTASGTAQTLAAASCTPPAGTKWALIVVETAAVRFRDDGTAPTASVGMLVNPTSTPVMTYNANFKTIQFIAVTGSPVVDISYYSGAGIP